MSESKEARRKRSGAARAVKVPKGVQPKADLIRSLTRQIERLAAHFRSNPKHWRSYPAKEGLRIKHQQRAEVLRALREQAPAAHEAIMIELNLTKRRIVT